MFSQKLKRLALLGGFAAAGLVFGPMAASADVNKCGKDITKNAAKISTDVQKELAKCVDSWLKDEDKVVANQAKGTTDADGASKGLLKAAEKCQKSLVKIGVAGVDIAVVDGVTEKGKIAKSYNKLIDAAGIGTAGKHKCGPKTYDQTIADQELGQLGIVETALFGDIGLRIISAGAVGTAWATQNVVNADTARAFGAMAENRCSLSGVACDDTPDCPGLKGDPETCVATNCPDCLKFGRAENSTLGPGGGILLCSASSPIGAFGPCVDETSCGGTLGVTDFCDDTPPGGAFAGPCHTTTCTSGGATATTLDTYVNGGAGGVFFCNETAADLAGTGTTGPSSLQCDPLDVPVANIPASVPITLKGTSPNTICDLGEVLPDAVAVSGGPARGLTADLVLGSPITVCVDTLRTHGYINKAAGTLPTIDVDACVDVNTAVDLAGAGAIDACASFSRCTTTQINTPFLPGMPFTAKNCQDATSPGPGTPGSSVSVNLQRTTVGSCLDISLAPGAPAGQFLTTGTATGNTWDAGPDDQTLTTQGANHFGSRRFMAGPANGSFSGTGYDLAALSQGQLVGATLVGTFGNANDDLASPLGHSLTTVVVECVAP